MGNSASSNEDVEYDPEENSWLRGEASDASSWKLWARGDEGACCEGCGLSKEQRLMGFVFCFVLGSVCSILSSTFVATVVIHPGKFAFFYTLGNILSLGSSSFLLGPVAQMKSMCHPSRMGATTLYIASLVLTLYFALVLKLALPTLLCIVVQMCAGIWYCASYVPFGRDCLRGACSGCIRAFGF